MGLDQFKKQYPQYESWDDQDLASALYEKYGESSGVARNEFMADIGRPQYMDATPSETESNMLQAGTAKQVSQEVASDQPQQQQQPRQQEKQIFGLGDEDFTNYPDNPELAASQIGEPELARAAQLNTPTPAPDNRPERTWGTTWDEALKAVPRAVGETFRALNEMSYQQSIKAAKGDPRVVERVNKARQNPDFLVKLATDPRFAAVNYKPTGKPHIDFWMDALNTAPVYGVMGLGTVVGGPAGGMIAMGTQIFGPAFEEGLEKGMDFDNAVNAAIIRTAGETTLEQLGFSRIMKNIVGIPGVRKAIESTVTEGATEYLQSQWGAAVNAYILGEQRGYSNAQLAKAVTDAIKDNHGQAKYEGTIGAVFGIGGHVGGRAGVAGYDAVIDKATKNLQMHLDTGISEQDPEKVAAVKKALDELKKLEDEINNAQDEIPDQQQAENELDPRLQKEMEARRLFGENMETPGGPRTFEGTGPGGTPAPVQQQTEAAPEQVDPITTIDEQEEAGLDDDVVDPYEQTMASDDAFIANEEDKQTAAEEAINNIQPGTVEEVTAQVNNIRKETNADPLFDNVIVLEDENGNGVVASQDDIKPGVIAIDTSTSTDPEVWYELETAVNARRKDGTRAWRFGFLLDMLEDMGITVKVTATNPDSSERMRANFRSAATFSIQNAEMFDEYVIGLNDRYIEPNGPTLPGASTSLAHELVHALMMGKRKQMDTKQRIAYYTDLAKTIANVDWEAAQRIAMTMPLKSHNQRYAESMVNHFLSVAKDLITTTGNLQTGNYSASQLASLEELLTYPLTEPAIAKFMDKVPVKSQIKGVKSLWDAFVRKVANTLGIEKGTALREIERLMSKWAGLSGTKAQGPTAVAKGYKFKSVNKELAEELNAIVEDYPEIPRDKKLDRFLVTAERANKREATPDRKFVDGEPALMKELGPDEFARRRFYINNKGKKVRWYTENDIKNFQEFRELAKEFIAEHPDFVVDVEQAISQFSKQDPKRKMPKGYSTSIIDGEVIDHPKGWLSPKKKAPKKAVKKAEVKPKKEPKPKAPPKVVKPKETAPKAPEKPSHPFPTKPGVVTIERGSKDNKMSKREYEVGYHFAIGEGTKLAAHFGDVTTYTKKITPGKFVIMRDPNTWDNWDSMLAALESSKGRYGESNDVKIDRLIDAMEHNRGEGAANYEDGDMEKIFRVLGLEGAMYNAIEEEGGGGPAIMFIDKPKVNKKKAPKKTKEGKTKQDVKQDIKQNQDILKNIKNTKYLEKEWAKAAGELSKALVDGDKELKAKLEARIDLIKAALFGGGTLSQTKPNGIVRDGTLPIEFINETERKLNEIVPGYDLKLEHFWPKSSGEPFYGYGFHVNNPDSVLYRASFNLVSDDIDPQVLRKMISDREQVFQDALAKKDVTLSQLDANQARYENPQMEEDHTRYRVGVSKDSWMTGVANFFVGVKNKFREFENISRKKLGEYAEVTKELRRLRSYRGIASTKAVAKLGKILNGMNKAQYDVFERLVTMADFWEQHQINEQRINNGEEPINVPFDWPKEDVAREFKKLVQIALRDPVVKNAWETRLNTWEELKQEYAQAMKDAGFNVEDRMKRTLYFRHQVVDYLKTKGPSTVATKKLATPTNRSHLRARKGTTRPINLNYIQGEYEVMAQLLYDIQIGKTIKTVKEGFDIIEQLKQEQGEQELENYEIPEGYVAWRPREGSIMYLADTIPSKLVEEAIAKGLKQLKVKTKDISKVLVIGRKHSEMVIPEDLAETLNSYLDSQKKGIVGRFFRTLMTGWKAYQLVSPFRVIKYNIRNMTGDAEAVFVGGQTLATGREMFSQAGVDIIRKLLGKETSSEYAEWVDRGGIESNFTAQEIAEILEDPEFRHVTGRGSAVKLFAKKVWKLPRKLTDAREQWMRYASYLAYLKKLESGNFTRGDYAASIPQEVDNLRDNRDKAFVLSNDLLGAYDRVTEAGDFMRRHVMPFYSFQEVNASRTAQIYRNMVANDKLVGSIGRKILGKTAAKSVVLTLATGQMAVTLMFWSTLLQIFNNLYYPEEEDALTDDLRETPHIYMGPPGSEEVKYFPRVGLLGDLLEWGNLQSAPLKLADLLTGRTTLDDAKKELSKLTIEEGIFDASGNMTMQLVNKIAGMVGPQYKVPFELATKEKLFPDVTNPKPIESRWAHFADQFFPKQVGDLIRERPMAKTWKSDMVSNLYTYKQDLTKMAYNATKARKVQWLKDMGFRGRGYHSSEKATAAYNMSLAFRYGDTAAFKKYFVDYIKLSYGQTKDIGAIMNQLDPLYGMTNQQKMLFVATLDKNELKGLQLAYKHYIELRSGVQFTGGK